jgi:chromosome segregation ATPase
MSAPGRWVGDVLIAKGLVNEFQLSRALGRQRHSGRRLGEILVEDGAITWFDLAMALAEQWESDEDQSAATAQALEPTIEELQEMLRDRQRRIIELTGVVTKLQRKVERLQAELRERDRLRLHDAASDPAA